MKEEYDLKELLDGINDSNIHEEISTVSPQGKEVW